MSELESIMIERFNVSEEALMEFAGEKLANFIVEEFSRSLKIAFIIGKGGNGGDGAVAARRLYDKGYDVQVYTPYEEDELSGELRNPVKEACKKINDWSSETVSVDVPTGLNVETQVLDENSVSPDYTVGLGAVKNGMTSTNSGEIYLADIGIMIEAFDQLDLEGPSFEGNDLIKAEE